MQNAKPSLENKDMRMGYKVVKIPTPVAPERGINIATKWFVESALEVRAAYPAMPVACPTPPVIMPPLALACCAERAKAHVRKACG